MKVKKETLFPKTKIQWLWENMKGRRVLYVIGMLGTVVYNILQLTVPYYSGRIVDLFLSGADAWKNMRTNSGLFYHLLILMIVFTVLRGVIVYGDCMIYEHVSQTVLYRVRNFLYDKIQRQDMTFYSTYRTGDLMTRVTGDLDAVRHMVDPHGDRIIFPVWCGGNILLLYELENGSEPVNYFAVCVFYHLSVQKQGGTDACETA